MGAVVAPIWRSHQCPLFKPQRSSPRFFFRPCQYFSTSFYSALRLENAISYLLRNESFPSYFQIRVPNVSSFTLFLSFLVVLGIMCSVFCVSYLFKREVKLSGERAWRVNWMQKLRLYDAAANILRGEFLNQGPVLDCCFHDDSCGYSATASADNRVSRYLFPHWKIGSHS